MLFQQPQKLLGLAEAIFVLVVLGAITLDEPAVNELTPARGQGGQAGLLVRGRGCGRRLEGAAIIAEEHGVNRIGFGAQPLGFGEMANPPGFDDADGLARGLESTEDGLFVASRGFADEVCGGMVF